MINDIHCSIIAVVESILKKRVDEKSIFTMSFRCKDQSVNVVVVWFLVQVFERIYRSNVTDPVSILEEVVNKIVWMEKMYVYTQKYSDAFQTLKMEIQLQIISFKYDM